jgi:cathepsin H
MLNLSEQQLVDCAGAFDNHGCDGGLPSHAFEYLMYAGGQDTEKAYPYTAATGKACNYNHDPAAKVIAVHNISAYDEDELLSAVGSTGPVSIAFQVSAAALRLTPLTCRLSLSSQMVSVVCQGSNDGVL